MRSLIRFIIASLLATLPQAASARDGEGWVVSWTGSADVLHDRGRDVCGLRRTTGGGQRAMCRNHIGAETRMRGERIGQRGVGDAEGCGEVGVGGLYRNAAG